MSLLLENNDQIQKIAQGEVLFREGELPEAFYLVVSGNISCLKWHHDRLVPIYTSGEKEIVGEDCVLADVGEYFYSAVAIEDSEVIKIEKNEVFKYLHTQKEWIHNILKNISEKLIHTSDALAEHKIMDKKLLKEMDFTDDMEAQLRKKL